MIYQQRVIYGDTDMMGVVYYGNYMRYFEGARAAYLRHLGHSNASLDEWDVALPVAEAHCNYRKPAYYEDLLDLDVHVSELRGASMRFDYSVRRGDVLVADGYTVHACVNKAGKLRRIPPPLRALIEGDARD